MEGRRHRIYQSFKQRGLMVRPEALDFLAKRELSNDKVALWLSSIKKQSLKNGVVDVKVLEETWARIDSERRPLSLAASARAAPSERLLAVVGAFDMPVARYDRETARFVRLEGKLPSIHGTADDRAESQRQRLLCITQRVARNPRFRAMQQSATLLQLSADGQGDLLPLVPVQALLGTSHSSLVLATLTQLDEGRYSLEDLDSSVELDLSVAERMAGIFGEGTTVLAKGSFNGERFVASLLALPPPEPADETRKAFPGFDFTGTAPNRKMLRQMTDFERLHNEHNIVVLSDVWLDNPQVMAQLRQLFEGYSSLADLEIVMFVFIGNFASDFIGPTTANNADAYRANFDRLADLILRFPMLASRSQFVFVPGPADPMETHVLPKPPIPKTFTKKLRERIPNVTFTTNPCRIRYCTQEMVVFREDLLTKLLRVSLPDTTLSLDPSNTYKHLVKTLIDQGHLCPVVPGVRPTYWSYDHALRLYPIPDVLVIADRADQYRTTYEGCYCFNPGSFASDFSFVAYVPATREADFSQVPSDETAASLSDAMLESVVADEQDGDRALGHEEVEMHMEKDEFVVRGSDAAVASSGDNAADGDEEEEEDEEEDEEGLSDTERAERAAKHIGNVKDDDDDEDEAEDDGDAGGDAQERAELDDLDVQSGFEDGSTLSAVHDQALQSEEANESPGTLAGDDDDDGGYNSDEEEVKRRRIR